MTDETFTDPVSSCVPLQADRDLTERLSRCLIEYEKFDSTAEVSHRMSILSRLSSLFNIWVRKVSLAKNVPRDIVSTINGKINTFGSFRLGVHTVGADIDTLCIAPRTVRREDFFNCFSDVLLLQRGVRNLIVVDEAYVPVIKLKFDGIDLDLVFARLPMESVPDDYSLQDDIILTGLDERCVRSLNGSRVTDAILDLVPDIEQYRLTLRSIKLWARQSGVYSNVLGYLGGVTWAIMVARICQLFPTAVAGQLVHQFFKVYSEWPWPDPVIIKPVEDKHMGFQVWDPDSNINDGFHMLPVITPVYPQQNSTYNVNPSSRKVILQEFQRAAQITDLIVNGECQWDPLFHTRQLFTMYRHFIFVILFSEDYNGMQRWHGLIESRLRYFVTSLDARQYVDIAHLFTKRFPIRRLAHDTYPNGVAWLVGLKFDFECPQQELLAEVQPDQDNDNGFFDTNPIVDNDGASEEANGNIDFTEEMRRFVMNIRNMAYAKRMRIDNVCIHGVYRHRADLSSLLNESIIQQFSGSNDEEHSYDIGVTSSADDSMNEMPSEQIISIEQDNDESDPIPLESACCVKKQRLSYPN